MSYQQALEAAGATVIQFEQFGSYQGEWFALVEFNGERGWVNGYYGSCSGCDAFEGEFGWGDIGSEETVYDLESGETRPTTQQERDAYQGRLADFGKVYLEGMLGQQAAETQAAANLDWDSDAAAMLEFVKSNAIQSH